MNDFNPAYGHPVSPSPVNNMTVVGNGEAVSVTIRAGSASDPVIIFKGSTNAEVADLIGAAEATGLFALIGNAATALKAHFNVGAGLGATPVQAPAAAEQQYYQQQPQQPAYQAPPVAQAPQQAPPGPAPSCPHGEKKYVAGTNNNTGKAYKFWGCPAPKGDPSQCPPQWIR